MNPINDKAEIIHKLCELLINDKKDEGISFINEKYPFVPIEKINSRQYSKVEMMKIFLRDGFIDRYSGEKLLFPGLIRLLTLEIPDIFKYHLNWKMSETHMIYWDMFPTIDHIIPIARGGNNNEENWITTNQLRNSAKSNFTIEELGWEILPKGNIEEWDGLCSFFLKWISVDSVIEKYKHTEDWKYIMSWAKALITVQNKNRDLPTKIIKQKITKSEQHNKTVDFKSSTETVIINVRELRAGALYKYTDTGKTYLVLSPYNPKTQKIAIAIIDSPNSNPANVICNIGTEKQTNVDVIQLIIDPRTPEEIIAQLPTEQKIKAAKLYIG